MTSNVNFTNTFRQITYFVTIFIIYIQTFKIILLNNGIQLIRNG